MKSRNLFPSAAWVVPFVCLALLISLPQPSEASRKKNRFDVGVLMATPGGIAAAVSAARMGMKVALIERSRHIGGLPANGLGATDIHTKELSGGFFREFTERILAHYTKKYGAESPQVKDCSRGFHFEPGVAEAVFEELIEKEKNITLFRGFQFDALPENVKLTGLSEEREIRIFKTRKHRKQRWIAASVWIDGSYEGDLAAAFGCRFRTYREGKSEFGEPMAGKIYKLWGKDDLEEGSTGEADSAIQAFNYRLCITKEPKNREAIRRPKSYNREEFASLAGDIRSGWVSGFFPKNSTTAGIVNPVKLPNGKYDANNHHRGLLSTDLPEENWPYPTAQWEWRDRFAERLRSYTEGLLYFAQNDTSLPQDFRRDALEYGFAKDEYRDNDHFPRQVYVREGRRIEGKSMFTAHDALPESPGKRPPVHRTSVVSSHYAIDSHAMHKREKGHQTLDGFISYQTRPFSVPYEVMVPIGKEQILCPVPVSASHVGYGCLRMEPCWMGLGHAAGVAASISIRKKCLASEVPIDTLQAELLRQGANLAYVSDVRQGHPDYDWVQKVVVLGWIPEFEARLDQPADQANMELWAAKSGFSLAEVEAISKNKSRKDALSGLWNKYQEAWKKSKTP